MLSEILLTLLLIVFIYLKRNKNKYFYENIPGPPTVPLFGNALDFRSTTKLLDILTRYTKEYGGIVRVCIGPFRKFVLISDYKFLEFVLTSTKLLNKSGDYEFLKPWLGNGLLTSEGSQWKAHRRMLTPTFNYQILTQFIEIFESCGEKLNEKLQKHAWKDSVDIYPLVGLCSLDVICETAMGTIINAQDNENSDYVRSVNDMCRIVVERPVSFLQMYDSLYPLTKNYYIQKKALPILHTLTRNIISSRQQNLENKKREVFAEDEISVTRKKKAFLDLLLELNGDGNRLTLEEIREEVDTFMFEGHETTASAISFSLYCLANYPDVQKRAFEEQQAIFENITNPDLSYASLRKMKYLDQVIKETLRLYPPVTLIAREINEEVEFDNKVLPKGDSLLIFTFGIHRNPRYFEDPETFNPSRFDNIDGKLPYAYIPFSAGPRNCIGQKFAMLEMKSIISKVLRKFELLPSIPTHELKLIAESILKSTTGIKIRLKLRN